MIFLNFVNSLFSDYNDYKVIKKKCSKKIYKSYPTLTMVYRRTKYIIQWFLVIAFIVVLTFLEVNEYPSWVNLFFIVYSLLFLWCMLDVQATE